MTKTLKEKIQNASQNFWRSAGVFAIAHSMDIGSTIVALQNNYNIDNEKNELARYLMHQTNGETGILIAGAISLPVTLGIFYQINKMCENAFKENNMINSLGRNLASLSLYYISIQKALATINNLGSSFN